MAIGMVRRLNISLTAGLLFLLVMASVAVLTTDRVLEAAIIGGLMVIAVTATWLVRRAIIRDLDARALAEERLRDSEARFAGILTIAADAIVTTDDAGRIVHFNRGAESIFGYATADVVGQPLDVLLPGDRSAAHREHVMEFGRSTAAARRMGALREVSGRRRNGEEFAAEASISKLPTPGGPLFTAVVRDVSEQRRREHHDHTLAVAGARLEATLDYESTLQLVADLPVHAAGDWCLVNVIDDVDDGVPALRRTTSSHSEVERHQALLAIEARGLDWDSPSDAIDVMRTAKRRVEYDVSEGWLEAHAADALELGDLRRLGVRSCATVPLVAHERVIGALTVGTSHRRLLPADVELIEALAERAALAIDHAALYQRAQRALSGRDQVLAVVSHDLRTPVAAIAMCARTLRDHPPASDSERRALYATIVEASDWMHRLIQDLLDAASIDAGRLAMDLRPEAVAQLVTAATDLFAERARSANIMLQAEVAPGLPAIRADPNRVVQLLGNLLGNALRFTAAGGAVTVTATARDDGVILAVRDTGTGIPPDHLPHIFDRFWRAEQRGVARGTGLGLAIAKGIADAHHGRIWVESEIGRGSTFFVLLPAA